ncbi:propionyl-CoA synthetase [Granulosicoccus antarcticus]|uniref:Acetyl-coenzyme A synthetase n=1 Tax=Granulosicoccus antarcticus IMCC3135 TaxID=1192854 RepID=A0A2Z2NYS3_9GAMM|nr:propionyl-CoA synthetase [Granulosicoccus antarcticus]ASJ75081.1 Acetyl-coenzyme A synthetase [Granulosicoccus antarcticus IMCC3135]
MTTYQEEFQRSLDDPAAYWLERAKDVHWSTPPSQGIDSSRSPLNTWFADGEINACYNALDVHVENGRGDQPALIHDSPVSSSQSTLSYRELLDQVALFAGVLKASGIDRGDRVMVYMPMIPQAVIAILACARIGAVHTVVFGGFAAKELAIRIDDCSPKVIVSASCGIEPGRIVEYEPLVAEAMQLASNKVDSCIVFQRSQCQWPIVEGRDQDWDTSMASATPSDCVPLRSTEPLYILYTSGTTGSPKGVVKDIGGTVVSLKWTMSSIYNVKPGDVYWAASDIGWVVGHSYIIYGPLFQGCTTVMYEGKPVGTPDAGAFWRVIEQHKVKVLFTAPTAFRAIKRVDPNGEMLKDYDLSSLQALYLAGERCDPDTLQWAQDKLKVPVIDHWWQTETGYAICANCQGIEALPIIAGSPSVAVPGYDVQVLNSEAERMPAGEIGSIVVKLPLPPGTFINLWGAEDRFKSAYFERFPGYYETGDAGFIDENGYVFVMARTDDVINVAGHRLSTGAMEEALSNHPDVAECAVMGVHDELKGQLPVGLVILNDGCTRPHEDITAELIKQVRNSIGPVAAFKLVAVVDKLPKTRSGKILRGTLRSIADSTDWKMPATIEDPTVLEDITQSLRSLGLAREPA